MTRTDDEADLAERFGWWWRSVFADQMAPISMAEVMAPFLEGIEHLLTDSPTPVSAVKRRRRKRADFGALNRLYGILNARRDRSAYLYELGKRITGNYEFGKPWIQLSEERKTELEKRWPATEERLMTAFVPQGQKLPEGFWRSPELGWNLKLNDGTLVHEFKRLLGLARLKMGIPNPPANKGRKHRGLSWRPVELMDIAAAKIRPFDDSERSRVSGAKRVYLVSGRKEAIFWRPA